VNVRSLVALAGWSEPAPAAGAWSGVDAAGRPVWLAHEAAGGRTLAAVATNEDRSVRAVFAGTLYNRRELRALLGGRHALAGHDDAEVVVHLYEERGVQCVRGLRGAFAFVLWDARLNRLLLARDQLGLVPLYFSADGRRLAAATRLPALTALPGLGLAWDATALDAFVALGTVPPPATFHPAIRQLRPGELALWQNGRLRPQTYWQPIFPERRMARRDLAVLVRGQLREALRLRQAGAVTGLLLSAGLAPAALLALAVAEGRPPAHTYTAVAPDAGADADAAAALAAAAGVAHVPVDGALDWEAAVDGLVATLGMPADGPDVLRLQHVLAEVAGRGEVALAGAGCEEVFGGTPAACAADRVRRFRGLPGVAREMAALWGRLPLPRSREMAALTAAERLAPVESYARAMSAVSPASRETLYTSETLAVLGDAGPWDALTGLFADAVNAGATDTADAVYFVDLVLRLPGVAALAGAAAAVGAELRLPFADHRLAQLIASIPGRARAGANDRQRLLRAAVGRLVPTARSNRAPTRALSPAGAWRTGALRAVLEDTLTGERLARQGVFRPDAVERLVRAQLAGDEDHGTLLWRVFVVTRWLESQTRSASEPARQTG
jgi:asparagine synthase (glutamine-hydrolysing)